MSKKVNVKKELTEMVKNIMAGNPAKAKQNLSKVIKKKCEDRLTRTIEQIEKEEETPKSKNK